MFYQLLQAKDVLPGYWDITPFVLGTGTNPSFPNPFIGSGPAVPLPSEAQGLYYGSGIRTPVDIQYNFNIQRDISKGMILTVGYTGSRGEHLMLGRDFNTPELINGEWATLGRDGQSRHWEPLLPDRPERRRRTSATTPILRASSCTTRSAIPITTD